jgi:site-specific DNA-methyltransferase (adenine-specific)
MTRSLISIAPWLFPDLQPVTAEQDRADIAPAAHAVHYARNVPQNGDALALLRALPDDCARLIFFDPQHRENLDKLKYGNEGARQRERCALPAMTSECIDECCFEIARVLVPSGYLMRWENAFQLVQGLHRHVEPALLAVDLISWDNQHLGMGYRARRRGDYLVILQKPPIRAKATWRDHGIPDRWIERVDREVHPHVKPPELIKRLIGAVTDPGDLVIDPAAGAFGVLHAARELGREFVGCDKAYAP